jgi:hypothetical protein
LNGRYCGAGKIENDQGDLRFYHLLIQHLQGNRKPYVDIHDAETVKIYGIKTECQNKTAFLQAQNCRDVEVYGLGGTTVSGAGSATLRFENCARVLAAAYTDQIGAFCGLMDSPPGGADVQIDSFQKPLLYVRDQQGAANPDDSAGKP